DVLKAGGSAVDAAIAANAALGLMEPVSNGIGGDLFAIVWDTKTQKLYGLNASGRSPYGLTREKMIELAESAPAKDGLPATESALTSGPGGTKLLTIPSFGPLPVTVPGCVDGWAELHSKFGKLPLKDDLAPAIRYARAGFPVTELIAHYWAAGTRLK